MTLLILKFNELVIYHDFQIFQDKNIIALYSKKHLLYMKNGFDLIIWKLKNDVYRCHINNCNIKYNTLLTNYFKNIFYSQKYDNIIQTKEVQLFNHDNYKIILQYINDDTISELKFFNENNMNILSCISHKIRNPLTNIIGVLSLIEDIKINENNKNYFDILKRSSYEIITVANDLVDILNLYNDEIKLNYEKINIYKLLTECKYIVTANIPFNKKINIVMHYTDIPDIIICDYLRLKQIIINLLNNSIQNTFDGYITLEVTKFNKTKSESTKNPFKFIHSNDPTYNLLFKIEDTGTGINEDTQKVLESWLIMNNRTQKNIDGFGLLISKQLCNLMRGNIWFKTDVGTGTTFFFNIICDCICIK